MRAMCVYKYHTSHVRRHTRITAAKRAALNHRCRIIVYCCYDVCVNNAELAQPVPDVRCDSVIYLWRLWWFFFHIPTYNLHAKIHGSKTSASITTNPPLNRFCIRGDSIELLQTCLQHICLRRRGACANVSDFCERFNA